MSPHRLMLLDSNGEPLEARIESALTRLTPRLIRQFPALRDDEIALIGVLEEAARRIAAREVRTGPLANLPGYMWVTVRSVATSFMRRGSVRLLRKTLDSGSAQELTRLATAADGRAEDIEREILLREVLAKLSAEERLVCLWKTAGFSSQEISTRLQRSVVSVDTIFSRAKARLRRLVASPRVEPEAHEL